GAVAPLARRAEVTPACRIAAVRGPKILLLAADVAPDAVSVPLLNGRAVGGRGPHDVHVVEPLAAPNVPARRQDDDPAVLERREVVLHAPAAERELDTMILRLAGQI